VNDDAPELVVLGLGSNRGDSYQILCAAIETLRTILDSMRQASVFETEPLYVADQERFLNTAVAGFFGGGPGELLTLVNQIEALFGRDRSRERRWGERTLDIDILLFGNALIHNPPVLEIPHPRLYERAFALIPLLELVPDARDPATGVPLQNILARLPEQGVRPFAATVQH
jgi:2-amino-4-hydroxy-6-hydroxymethyldihydropteridine diphosphokinase